MLSDTKARAAKPSEKPYKLYDERGLFLFVTPTGGRLWRLKYQMRGREKLISLGAYPDVGLKRAREKRDEARKLIADCIDPSAVRQERRTTLLETFEAVAQEWLELQTKLLAPETISILGARLKSALYPYLGSKPVAEITAQELLGALRRIEARGRHETAHRVRALAGRVLRYAVATGRAQHDVAADLKEALAPVKSKNFASVTDPRRVGELMRAIHGYSGHPVTALALKLAPLVFVRPGELRAAEWSEFDLENAEWRIPGARMKMGEPHIVPLARQALAILRELQPLARGGRYLFPSLRTRDRPMSDNTINAALRRLGYTSEEQTGHGFRSMASTLLNEQGFPPDVIELQLAHTERNKVRAAYNKAQRLPERRKMMQAWANYLDALRAGKEVAPSVIEAGQTPRGHEPFESKALAESQLMTAGDLLRGTLRLLWYALRLPALTFLVILEPIVRFFLGALALLGVLTALFFKFYGVPHFPFALMLGVSVGLGLMLTGYYALLRVFGS